MATIQKANNQTDRDDFIFTLVKQHKMRQIGHGEFGAVFAPPNTNKPVVKVCRDEAYEAFITQILDHQTNPWFPKVYSATVHHPKDGDPYLVVEMERLRKGSFVEIQGAVGLFTCNPNQITAIGSLFSLPTKQMQHLSVVRKVLAKLHKKYAPDIHKGNILFRGNQAVLTDPVVAANKTSILTQKLPKVNLGVHNKK